MPNNKALLDLNEFSKNENCKFSWFSAEPFFDSVSIDSRIVTKNSLFVALKGEKADGHDFIHAALEKGASAIFVSENFAEKNFSLCEELSKKYNASFLAFSNTLFALQRLAADYVKKFPHLKRVAVTGSSGKTTTKEMIGSILSQKYDVVMNEGNLNSETGLPLSVFKIRDHHQVGIFEMGMNRRNEIGELADVLVPHIGVIVNIGTAHIGLIGSKKNIAAEKRRIFKNFGKNDIAIMEEDTEWKDFLSENLSDVRYFGEKSLGITELRNLGIKGFEFNAGIKIGLSLPGYHNLKNAMAAMGTARLFDKITPEDVKKGLEDFKPISGRSQIFEKFGIFVVNDAYNANPSSMEAAIDFCNSCNVAGRKFYVLGDMLELGESAARFHEEIVKNLTELSGDDCFVILGNEFHSAREKIAKNDSRFYTISSSDEAKKYIEEKACEGDLVLFKASNGMGLWKIAQNIFEDEK